MSKTLSKLIQANELGRKTTDSIFNTRLKAPKSFFQEMLKQIPVFEFKNKSQTIISLDETKSRKVVSKRLTSKTNLNFTAFYNFSTFVISKTRVEYQSYCVWQEVVHGMETFHCEPANTIIMKDNKVYKRCYRNEKVVHDFLLDMYSPMTGKMYGTRWIITNKIDIQKNEDFKYLFKNISFLNLIEGSKSLYGHHSSRSMNSLPFNLMKIYKHRFLFEMLMKATKNETGRNLLDIATSDFDLRIVTPKFVRRYKSLLKIHNLKAIQLAHRLTKKIPNQTQTIEMVGKFARFLSEHCRTNDDFIIIQKLFTQNVVKNIKYLTSYFEKNNLITQDMADHIRMLRTMDIELSKENIFPKNFHQEHSLLTERYNTFQTNRNWIVNRAKISLRKAKAIVKKLKYQKMVEKDRKIFNQRIDAILFKVPEDISDLDLEGKALHHCVGTYKEKVIDGKSKIIFVRNIADENQPYYTLELDKDSNLVQLRGDRNKSADSFLELAVDKYVERLKGIKHDKHKEQQLLT